MTTHNPPTSDRNAMLAWLCLLALAVILMFFGTLALISLLPGVDATALYTPITSFVWGNAGHLPGAIAITIAFVVAWRGIAPAIRSRLMPNHRADRKAYATALAERNEAVTKAKAAEQQAQHATQRLDALMDTVTQDYATLYGDTPAPPPAAMLAEMRVELLSLRPLGEQTQTVVRERDTLRTQVTDLLNRPVILPITWAQLLPLIEYVTTARNLTVKGVRDEVRKLAAIPEGEYATFSAAVRALSAYSPTKKGTSAEPKLTVEPAILLQSTTHHGRNTAATDGASRPRTKQKRRRKLPTAKKRLASKVQA